MIAQLTGTIASQGSTFIIINVNGVGYLVNCTQEAVRSTSVGETVTFSTYLAVRENALELFGFQHTNELNLFSLLLNVPGIGPRSALSIVALAPIGMLAQAIKEGDSTALTKVSGVGKKSAEKIVIELKDKVDHLIENEEGVVAHRSDDMDTLEALTMLGYSQTQARNALTQIPSDVTGVQQRLKEALKLLGR